MSRAFHYYGEDFTAEVEKSKGMEGHRKGEESYNDCAARGCHTTGKLLSKYKFLIFVPITTKIVLFNYVVQSLSNTIFLFEYHLGFMAVNLHFKFAIHW